MYVTEETANNSLVTFEKELKEDFPYLLSKLLIKLKSITLSQWLYILTHRTYARI